MTLLTQRQVQELQHELQTKSTQLNEVLAMFAYTLRLKCESKISIDMKLLPDYMGWGINCQKVEALGILKVVPLMPDGQAIDPDDHTHDAPATIVPEPIYEPDTIGDPCEAYWHKDPERVGLLCPVCGSKAITGDNHEAQEIELN